MRFQDFKPDRRHAPFSDEFLFLLFTEMAPTIVVSRRQILILLLFSQSIKLLRRFVAEIRQPLAIS